MFDLNTLNKKSELPLRKYEEVMPVNFIIRTPDEAFEAFSEYGPATSFIEFNGKNPKQVTKLSLNSNRPCARLEKEIRTHKKINDYLVLVCGKNQEPFAVKTNYPKPSITIYKGK